MWAANTAKAHKRPQTAQADLTVACAVVKHHQDVLQGGQGLLPEVIEFDAYEEEYGTEGNWHSDDHKEFLRVLHSHKGDYAATVLECSERMVGFDRLDILAHARWHSQYEELAIRKKLAIQAWRRQREEEARAQRKRSEDAVGIGPAGGGVLRKCAPDVGAVRCGDTHCSETRTIALVRLLADGLRAAWERCEEGDVRRQGELMEARLSML